MAKPKPHLPSSIEGQGTRESRLLVSPAELREHSGLTSELAIRDWSYCGRGVAQDPALQAYSIKTSFTE